MRDGRQTAMRAKGKALDLIQRIRGRTHSVRGRVIGERRDRRRLRTCAVGIGLRDAGQATAAIVDQCGRAAREIVTDVSRPLV